MNNTIIPRHHHYHPEVGYQVQIVLLSLMLAACLFGNILVTSTIIRTKKLRIPSNILVVNLSLCDMMTSLCAIPFTLIIFNIYHNKKTYPFGKVGCKLLWPITTYACNCSVFTLATIAIERYLNIISIDIKFNKKVTFIVIGIIHLLAIAVVVPYCISLTYEVIENEVSCNERWKDQWQAKAYTISLFVIQYALPLIVMAIFYILAWRKLYTHNILVIKMSEEYERKMNWKETYRKGSRQSSLCDDSVDIVKTHVTNTETKPPGNTRKGYKYKNNTGNVKHQSTALKKISAISVNSIQDAKRFNKSRYASQVAYIRHRQSLRTLRMFTVVVIVFALFALPNQITWLMIDFSELSDTASYIIILLTYVSPVMNCWIYGWFHSGIRAAYVQTIRCSCNQRSYDAQPWNGMNIPSSPSLYTTNQEELFKRRMSSFNYMFRKYGENVHIQEESEVFEEDTGL